MGKKRIITKTDTADSGTKKTEVQAKSSKKVKKQVISGVANIFVSYNNTSISIADTKGNLIAWSSAGFLGFKGAKKSTPYAANLVARDISEKVKKFGTSNLRIVVKGVGPGRESAMRGLAANGFNITSMMDNTPMPHNGVRRRKPRRV